MKFACRKAQVEQTSFQPQAILESEGDGAIDSLLRDQGKRDCRRKHREEARDSVAGRDGGKKDLMSALRIGPGKIPRLKMLSLTRRFRHAPQSEIETAAAGNEGRRRRQGSRDAVKGEPRCSSEKHDIA